MKTVIVVELDLTTPDELEVALRGVHNDLPFPLAGPIKVATGDVAERILSTFVVEGKEAEWKRKNG